MPAAHIPVRQVPGEWASGSPAQAAGDATHHQQRHTAGSGQRGDRRVVHRRPASRRRRRCDHRRTHRLVLRAGGIFPAAGLAPRPGHRRDPCERIGGQVQDHRGTHLRQEPFSDGQGVRTRARSRAALDYLRRPVRLCDGLVPVERRRLRGPGSACQQAVRDAAAMTPMTPDDLTGQVFGAFALAPGDRPD